MSVEATEEQRTIDLRLLLGGCRVAREGHMGDHRQNPDCIEWSEWSLSREGLLKRMASAEAELERLRALPDGLRAMQDPKPSPEKQSPAPAASPEVEALRSKLTKLRRHIKNAPHSPRCARQTHKDDQCNCWKRKVRVDDLEPRPDDGAAQENGDRDLLLKALMLPGDVANLEGGDVFVWNGKDSDDADWTLFRQPNFGEPLSPDLRDALKRAVDQALAEATR